MSEYPENKRNRIKHLLDLFRSVVDNIHTTSHRSYQQAVGCFASFARRHHAPFDTLSESLLADWFTYMYLRGITRKSAFHHLNALSGLYKRLAKNGDVPSTSLFKDFKSTVRDRNRTEWDAGIDRNAFDRFLHILKEETSRGRETSITADLILFSLINKCLPIAEVAKTKCRDLDGASPEVSEIVRRQSDSCRRYVFALKQSERTPRQLDRHANYLILRFFERHNLPFFESVGETLASYWAYAALACGASGSEVVHAIGRSPKGIPVLALYAVTQEDAAEHPPLQRLVGSTFVFNPRQWFAMKLRPRVKFEDIEKRFSALTGRLNLPELFYPCDEIAKRIGKKLTYKKKPLISDVVFFRCAITEIAPLFNRIGDLAWCYTMSDKHNSTYAVIPRHDFEKFQQVIGQFTPDCEVAPLGALKLREGEKIVIVGGLFRDQHIDLKTVEQRNASGDIYRIRFDSDNGFDWRIGVDAKLIRAAECGRSAEPVR